MIEEELIIRKLKHENIHVINSYKKSLTDYSSTIATLRKQSLMSEEVAKSSLTFDQKLTAVNKTLGTKDDIDSLKNLLLKLPTITKNIDNTNLRLKKYLEQKAKPTPVPPIDQIKKTKEKKY